MTILRLLPGLLFLLLALPPHTAAAEPIDAVAEAMKTPLGLAFATCPDQETREATEGGYQLFCGVTSYDQKEFRKQWSRFLKKEAGGDRYQGGRWNRTGDLSHQPFWYRDMAGILTYHEPSKQVLLVLRHTMQACSTPAPEPPGVDNIVPPVAPINDRVYYPEEPKQSTMGLRVKVRVLVNEDGSKSALCIVNPDPKALYYNNLAIDKAQLVPYQPATSNGEPIPMEVDVIALFFFVMPDGT